MAVPFIYQGADKTIRVASNIDATTATEIELRIDAPEPIIKRMTEGHITSVTSTKFDVAISVADTKDVCAGNYLIQTRITDSLGKIIHGRLKPNKVRILESSFVSNNLGNDYG